MSTSATAAVPSADVSGADRATVSSSHASTPATRVPVAALVAGAVLIAVVTWAAFAALAGAEVAAPDDAWLILSHSRWHGDGAAAWAAETTRGGAWRPLFWLSLAADRAAGGAESLAAALHRGSLLLHALSAVALGLLTHRLATFATRDSKSPRPRLLLAATIAATLAWAVHPLRAETVASIAARGEVIAALAVPLAGLAWIRAVGDTALRPRAVAATAALAAVAVLASPSASAYPAALLALTLWMGRVAPQSAAGTGAGRALAAASIPGAAGLVIALINAPAAPGLDGVAAGLAGAARAVAPIRDTLVAAGLHAAHGADSSFPDEIRPAYWVDAAMLLIGLILAARSVRRAGGAGAALLAYGGFIALRALVVREPFGSDVDAHVATLPLFAALAVSAACAADHLRALAAAGLAGAALFAGIQLPSVLPAWRTADAVWERVLEWEPANDRALAAKGDAALRGESGVASRREAEAWYRRSVDLGGWRPWGQAGIGALQLEGGDLRVGIERLTEATRLAPWLPEPRFQLGALLHRLGEHGEAISHLRRAVVLDPESAPAWFQLGISARAAGDVALAVAAFERAVAIAPSESRYAAELAAARASAEKAPKQPR